MAGNTASLIKGFNYQHLLSWYHILSLKKISEADYIKLENKSAGNVDDVTIYKKNGDIDFYQIKYHVSMGSYSIENMLPPKDNLLENFWTTWKKLIKNHSRDKIRLILYSNWVPQHDDVILTCIDGDTGSLGKTFFDAAPHSDCGKKRENWRVKHKADNSDFMDFTKSISFHLGRNFTEELKSVISERMQLYNLCHDDNALLIAAGIVNNWITKKIEVITIKELEEKIAEHNLGLLPDTEKSTTVYFVTIKDRKFDLLPDYILDWRHYFQNVGGSGGHEPVDSQNWNNLMLPELLAMEERINNEKGVKLIKARGFARLSPWFAFGYTFSGVAGYILEVNQAGQIWRTDEKPNPDFKLISENGTGEIISSGSKCVAVGISITGSLEKDVRKHIATIAGVEALLLLRPEKTLGPTCFETNADVVSFVRHAKETIRLFVRQHDSQKLLLYYFGPLSGACFLGHQLNAVCREIQIMENIPGSYTPAFLLK